METQATTPTERSFKLCRLHARSAAGARSLANLYDTNVEFRAYRNLILTAYVGLAQGLAAIGQIYPNGRTARLGFLEAPLALLICKCLFARRGGVYTPIYSVDQELLVLPLLFMALLLAPVGMLNAQSRNLELYWIDVEGGASTLIVSPSGESLLIDTGWMVGDRDAKRIYAATQQAGLKNLDYLVISHFHADHVGGLAALSKMIPIGRFFDHGDAIEKENQQWLDSYKAASVGKRTIVKPGDRIPIKGIQVLVVASNEQILSKPVNGGRPNPLCEDAEQKAPASPENQRTIGLLLTSGKFKFLNLIDIDWAKEMELSCPVNKLGQVTLYQTSRHGSFDGAGSPAFLGAIKPQVVVVNNGPRKGMGQVDNSAKSTTPPGQKIAPYEKNAYERIAKIPGIEGIWQGHLSLLDPDPKHNTSEDQIANIEDTADCKGNWIKASVTRDGKFTITNGRNGFSKTYQSH